MYPGLMPKDAWLEFQKDSRYENWPHRFLGSIQARQAALLYPLQTSEEEEEEEGE